MTPAHALETLVFAVERPLGFGPPSRAWKAHDWHERDALARWLFHGARRMRLDAVTRPLFFLFDVPAVLGLQDVLDRISGPDVPGVVGLLYASARLRAAWEVGDLTKNLDVPRVLAWTRQRVLLQHTNRDVAVAALALDKAARDPALPDDLRERAVVIAVQLRLELLGL